MRYTGYATPLLAATMFALLGACQSEISGESAPVDGQAAVDAPAPTPEPLDPRASIANALAEAASTSGPGAPAMWRVADEDTTLYLFGTVHLLKPETEWRTAEFDAAFAEADTLVTEVDTHTPEGLAAIQTIIAQRGSLSEGQTLTGLLDEDDEAVVAEALGSVGIPIAQMDTLQPWLAGLTLSVLQIQKSGYSPDSGVETILTAQASEAGKRFGYLETAEQQMGALAGGTLEDQIEGLVFTAETLDLGAELLGTLVDEWADGDVAGLSAIVADPISIGGADAYQRLLVDRNANWVPQIKAMLDEPGTRLIAVGAAHLAGPDSVVDMLRDQGVKVEPY